MPINQVEFFMAGRGPLEEREDENSELVQYGKGDRKESTPIDRQASKNRTYQN